MDDDIAAVRAAATAHVLYGDHQLHCISLFGHGVSSCALSRELHRRNIVHLFSDCFVWLPPSSVIFKYWAGRPIYCLHYRQWHIYDVWCGAHHTTRHLADLPSVIRPTPYFLGEHTPDHSWFKTNDEAKEALALLNI
jgi:hypothetical protein